MSYNRIMFSRLVQFSTYCRILPHLSYSKKICTTSGLLNNESDFFGFSSYESTFFNKETNDSSNSSKKSVFDTAQKFSEVFRSSNENLETRKKELIYDMTFGDIRFDKNDQSDSTSNLTEQNMDNIIVKNRQKIQLKTGTENSNLQRNSNLLTKNNPDNLKQHSENFVDEQYFSCISMNANNLVMEPKIGSSYENENQQNFTNVEDNYLRKAEDSSLTTNIFEEQYFDNSFKESEITQSTLYLNKDLKDASFENVNDLVHEQYFQFPNELEYQQNEEFNKNRNVCKDNLVENHISEPDKLLMKSYTPTNQTEMNGLTNEINLFDDINLSSVSSPQKKSKASVVTESSSVFSNSSYLKSVTKNDIKQSNVNETENSSINHQSVLDNELLNKNNYNQTFTDKKSVRILKNIKDKSLQNTKDTNPIVCQKASHNAPVTAHDFITNIRNEKKNSNLNKAVDKLTSVGVKLTSHTENVRRDQLDSKGFIVMKSRVPELWKFTTSEIVTLLMKNIVYNDYDILALNKPYGMCCFSEESDSKSISLSTYFKDLAKLTQQNSDGRLYLTHRLDRTTSGVILLAKTQRMATILSEMFAEQKVLKTYHALVKGVPQHFEGIIDIPIIEGTVDKKYRMVLSPELKSESGEVVKFGSSKAHKAVTHYKVLQSQMSTSLLEVRPQTGYKHQIRVHLGFGLGCPIIGDHKYTYLTKLVPQKLPGDVLDALGVRQSKVRHIPMHLHSKSVMLPELLEGKNIFIEAKLPIYFTKTLHSLHYKKS